LTVSLCYNDRIMEEGLASSSHNPADVPSHPPSAWKQRLAIAGLILITIALVVGVGFAIASMIQSPQQTQTIRDIFIIFMAVESLIIGLALIILIIQLARLTALLQNEIRPILESTNRTVSTLRGTTTFLSDNITQPVVKMSSSLAALKRLLDLVRIRRPE
jgi:ABC-type spermidine/putrescine transport system permease subunit II